MKKLFVLFRAIILQNELLVFLEGTAEGSKNDPFNLLHLHLLHVIATIKEEFLLVFLREKHDGVFFA